jgi:phosphohistidine phosphatase
MKRLYIIRHAKSSWKDITLRDIDRPLNKRGKNDAPLIARVLHDKGYQIDYLILSPSQRTKDTVDFFKKEFEIPDTRIQHEEALYHGYSDDFEQIINGLSEDMNNVALFGHNPGITFIANSCIGRGISNVPTTGVVVLDTDIENWGEFSFEKAIMENFLFPKQYK